MKPLIVLLTVFVLALLGTKLLSGDFYIVIAMCIAMSAMLLFTSIGHFAFTKGMTMMMPDVIPLKKQVVYFTGIIEIVAAAALLFDKSRLPTAWFLIGFFILLLPANINAAIKKVDYQKGTFDGAGLNYLWFRIPLQVLFIGWLYLILMLSH